MVVGEGGGEYSRIRARDWVQDLDKMKDQGSGGVTPSPAEGEVFFASFCFLACNPISHGFQRLSFTFLSSASCDLVMIHDRHPPLRWSARL